MRDQAASTEVVDEDITKASQEVAEISRLIGKPLTDSHALAMLKGILLEKIHTKLEETKDISGSSKSTEEGVNKFVAALAASKKKNAEQEGIRLSLEWHESVTCYFLEASLSTFFRYQLLKIKSPISHDSLDVSYLIL